MRTIEEQIKTVNEVRVDLQHELLRAKGGSELEKYISDQIDSLLDVSETLKRFKDLIDVIREPTK